MKRLLFLFCMAPLIWACSSNENKVPDEPVIPEMMRKFDISETDTVGLRIFGYAEGREEATLILLGNKNGHLWLHFVNQSYQNDYLSESEFKKVKTIITKSKFNDTQIYDLGYGEIDTAKVHYINFHTNILKDNRNHRFRVFYHNENNFSICSHLSWIIYNGEVTNLTHHFETTFLTGYYGWSTEGNNKYRYIFNEKGEILYPYYDRFKDLTFIDINKYMDINILGNNHTIFLCEASKYNNEKDFIIWSHSEKLGSIIDNHDPRIEYTVEHNTDIITWRLKATNYDGTKEEKTIKLDIKTGNVID